MAKQFWHEFVKEQDIEEAKEVFRSCFKIPVLTSVNYDEVVKVIESSWSFIDVEDLSSKKSYKCMTSLDTLDTSGPIHLDCSSEIWTSCGVNRARLFLKQSKACIEVFDDQKLVKAVNLSENQLHGDVYFDVHFKGFSMNPSCTKLAYIAEKKRPKSMGFFDDLECKEDVLKGQEFNFVDDWGEQMSGKSESVVVILDLIKEDFKVISNDKYCFGNVLWINDEEVVGTATKIEAYRLGIVFTTSKPTDIFKVNVSNNSFEIISDEGQVCCRSPRLSPDMKTLIWMQRDLHERTHACCLQLKGLDLMSKETKRPRLILDTKWDFEPEKDNFAGLNRPFLPDRCFISDDEIIFNAVVIDKPTMFRCNIKSTNDFKVIRIDDDSATVLEVCNDGKFFFAKSNPLESHSLCMGQFQDDSLIASVIIEGQKFDENSIEIKTLIHDPQPEHMDPGFRNVKFSSIFVGSKSKKQPLILWPHGGPHAVFTREFSYDVLFWSRLGYSILRPNFRGSLGFGQSSVFSLAKFSGVNDVQDCYQAVQECLNQYPNLKKDQVVLYGGSHGGKIILHLSLNYPDFFKACVARNPVTNGSTKAMVADNPDSGFNLSGLQFEFQSPDSSTMEKLLESSPLKSLRKVNIPIHLNLGSLDRRVPMSQGIEFWRNMRALGNNVSINVYEDNHSLSKPKTHCNALINAFLFFQAILNT